MCITSYGEPFGAQGTADHESAGLWDHGFEEPGSVPSSGEREADGLPGSVAVAVAVAVAVGESELASVEQRSHCPAGDPYDADNTYVNRQGWRSCRTCKRLSDRRRRSRTAKNLTPEDRTLRARLGAYRLHALYDPKETTKKARAAFAARFDRQVDPNGMLSPAERARRADAARRAYFTELQLGSSQVRRRR